MFSSVCLYENMRTEDPLLFSAGISHVEASLVNPVHTHIFQLSIRSPSQFDLFLSGLRTVLAEIQ